jgi:hypothetical protein
VLKPGPFVHGEVQLGGLPDRVSPSLAAPHEMVLDASGKPATSQGLVLPSLFCDTYRADVRHWLRAVGAEVLTPMAGRGGAPSRGSRSLTRACTATPSCPPIPTTSANPHSQRSPTGYGRPARPWPRSSTTGHRPPGHASSKRRGPSGAGTSCTICTAISPPTCRPCAPAS